MNFGQKLKQLRIQNHKSQAKVAKEISTMFPHFTISQGYLSALERKKNAPREEVLNILSAYFDVPVVYFLSEAPDATDKQDKGIVNSKAMARDYLRSLKNRGYSNDEVAAHTYDKRDREISKNLRDFSDKFEDEEF
jgi:transcriptional regulator with XRE-family HTH domain